ncbi:MAG: hypothetical protein LBV49_11385 [Azonexus sp.]|jgi:hypothetical protein|nr:hypothetical protein [Azonexus sp.]
MFQRFLLAAALVALLPLPVLADELICPDLKTLAQVNACPTDEELQHTYHGYCSDDNNAYGKKTDTCPHFEDYRKMKNVARWESADGRFDGYLSCDLPDAAWRDGKPGGIALAMQGKITKVVCSYPNNITLTYRTRENCTVAEAKACADDPTACRATCNP